jgi:hypothetical protein
MLHSRTIEDEADHPRGSADDQETKSNEDSDFHVMMRSGLTPKLNCPPNRSGRDCTQYNRCELKTPNCANHRRDRCRKRSYFRSFVAKAPPTFSGAESVCQKTGDLNRSGPAEKPQTSSTPTFTDLGNAPLNQLAVPPDSFVAERS